MKKIILLIAIASLNVFGQQSSGAHELLLPVGARSLALSNSSTAGVTGIEAVYYNPAGLAYQNSSLDALFSHLRFIADVGMSYMAVSSNFGDAGSVGISLKSIDVGDIPVTTTQQPYGTGEIFSPTLIIAGISYGRFFSDNMTGGMSVNVIYEKIGRTSATGVSFDFGIQYSGIFDLNDLKLGVVLKNLGPVMKYEGADLLRTAIDSNSAGGNALYKIDAESFELPMHFDAAVSYKLTFEDKYSMLVNAGYSLSSFFNKESRVGLEFGFDNLFFIRGGMNFPAQNNSEERSLFGPTFGAGINIETFFNISVDYAYRTVHFFQPNQLITIKIGF